MSTRRIAAILLFLSCSQSPSGKPIAASHREARFNQKPIPNDNTHTMYVTDAHSSMAFLASASVVKMNSGIGPLARTIVLRFKVAGLARHSRDEAPPASQQHLTAVRTSASS